MLLIILFIIEEVVHIVMGWLFKWAQKEPFFSFLNCWFLPRNQHAQLWILLKQSFIPPPSSSASCFPVFKYIINSCCQNTILRRPVFFVPVMLLIVFLKSPKLCSYMIYIRWMKGQVTYIRNSSYVSFDIVSKHFDPLTWHMIEYCQWGQLNR